MSLELQNGVQFKRDCTLVSVFTVDGKLLIQSRVRDPACIYKVRLQSVKEAISVFLITKQLSTERFLKNSNNWLNTFIIYYNTLYSGRRTC